VRAIKLTQTRAGGQLSAAFDFSAGRREARGCRAEWKVKIASRQLRQLVVLARSGSFAAAARRLSLTEPALLRNVQSLERELGLRLFHRRHGGIALTSAGEIVVGRAERVVDALETLSGDVLRSELDRLATLRLGAGMVPRIRLLPVALARFVESQPGVKVEVNIGAVGGFLRALLREEIDVYVGDVVEASADPRFEVIPLSPEPGVWVVRDGHPLAGRAAVAPHDLSAHTLAHTSLPPRWRALLETIAPRSWIRCDDLVTLQRVVLESDAVGLLPRAFVIRELAAGALRAIPVALPELTAEVGVVVQLGTRAREAIAALIVALRAADRSNGRPSGYAPSETEPNGVPQQNGSARRAGKVAPPR
jgi:DNA-binding transcriptional LysR family regulator